MKLARFLIVFFAFGLAFGQVTTTDSAGQLATRLLQLVESTAVAVPGLIRASESIRQNAATTLSSIQRTPQNPAPTYLFINQVKAYLALSDSMPRPDPFPPEADRQYSELREDLQRMGRIFEASLASQNSRVQAKDADPSNLKRYAEENTKVLPPGKLPRVVFLGASIIEFWHLNEYFTGRDFLNRGIGGQTTIEVLGRFLQDVVALHPKAVLILAGTNDIAHGMSPAATEDDLSMMGDLAKAHGIKPAFASITPASDYHKDVDPRYEMVKDHPLAAIQQINQWMQAYCRRENLVYVDFYTALADSSGQFKADLSDDGLHPNARGYQVMAPIALDAIGRALAATGSTPAEEAPQAKRRFHMLGK